MYDYQKLRGKIREILENEYKCAELLNLSYSSISAKLNSKVPFSIKEMDQLIETLSIPKEQIYDYFFYKKVENNSTKEIKEET